MTTAVLKELKVFAARIRLETIRAIGARGFGHAGGSLSVSDVLAALYGQAMCHDPGNPAWEKRDKLVMSKGHAGPALYAALALKGYFPAEWLPTLNQPGTRLPSHCDRKLTPGVDMTTGSLGQGASTAVGLALAQKLDDKDGYVYLITGDGELDEGQVWEAALFAPHHRLDNLIWFIDYNHRQLDGTTDEVLALGDVAKKVDSFGWHAQSADGHDIGAIIRAITAAKAVVGKPSCIVLNTVKGHGIKCIEDITYNHHITLEGDLLRRAVREACEGLAAAECEGVS